MSTQLLQKLQDKKVITTFEDKFVWWPQGDLFTEGSIGIILTDEQVAALEETETMSD
jgi:hypothetical protein